MTLRRFDLRRPPLASRRAFSLVEVVVATGIFAFAIVSVIGLVAAVGQNVSDVRDGDDASRVVANLQSKLHGIGFDVLRNYMGDVEDESNLDKRIYASRDGSRIGFGDSEIRVEGVQRSIWDPKNEFGGDQKQIDAQKYFLIELQESNTLSPESEGFVPTKLRRGARGGNPLILVVLPMIFVSSGSRRSLRGFTLVELLVAIGVTAILVTLMLTITLSVLNAWNRSSGKLSANATARLVLDQLAQDLSAVVMRQDGNVWLAATVQRDQKGNEDAKTTGADWGSSEKPAGTTAAGSLVVDEAKMEDLRFGQAGVWLRYFVAQPDTNDGNAQNVSAPRAVSVQVIRRDLGSNTSPVYAYQLYRAEARPYHQTAGPSRQRSAFEMGYDLYTTASNGYNHNATGAQGDASNIRNPNVGQLIGNDVVDFGVRFYERDREGNLVEAFPVNRLKKSPPIPPIPPASAPFTYAATSDTSRSMPSSGFAHASTGPQVFGFPVEAELMVRVLTPEGVRQLQAFEEDTSRFPGQTWWDIVIKNSDVFTRRVEIKSSAL